MWKHRNKEAALLKALQDAQQQNMMLESVIENLTRECRYFRSVASLFLDYRGPEMPGSIPIRITFLDFTDDDAEEALLDMFEVYEDKFYVRSFVTQLGETVTENKYVIIQPDMTLSPAGARAVCEELNSRFTDMIKDISVGARVNEAISGESFTEEREQESVRFTIDSPDRSIRTDGNVLYLSSNLFDLSKYMSGEERKAVQRAFPEYKVLIEEWDS